MDPKVHDMYEKLKDTYKGAIPDAQLRAQAQVVVEIETLKKQRNALILGHNYIDPLIFHSISDVTGDSLDLSRKAAQTDKDLIVFCGVRFMAETAKILNPAKTVLLPSLDAGCSLAASISAHDVCALKERFPGVPVVSYVNTYADVKAESDICCTSSNAQAVVESLCTDTVIFLPDEYLAGNVARATGKHIVFPSLEPDNQKDTLLDYQFIGWHGRCEVHEKFSVQDIDAARTQYADVLVLAHPECSPEVVAAADFVGSTNAMIRYIQETTAPCYLLLTECALADTIAIAYPDKQILRRNRIRCPHMDTINLENTRDALKFHRYVIELDEHIRKRAYRAVERMIQIG